MKRSKSNKQSLPDKKVSNISLQTETQATDYTSLNKNKSTDRLKRFFTLQNIFTISSLLISVGAYSVDSILVKWLTFKDTFRVVTRASIYSSIPGSVVAFQPFHSLDSTRLYLSPIKYMVYLTISNQSDVDQSIDGLKFEFKDDKGKWHALSCIDASAGLYFPIQKFNYNKARLITFEDRLLLQNLNKGLIKPREVVKGWLFAEASETLQSIDFNQNNVIYRVTLFTDYGEVETHNLDNSPNIENKVNLHGAMMKANSRIINMSDYEVKIRTGLEAIQSSSQNL